MIFLSVLQQKCQKWIILKLPKLIVRYPKTILFEMYALTGIITVENITIRLMYMQNAFFSDKKNLQIIKCIFEKNVNIYNNINV